jgi:hypothetical protein
LITPRDIIFNPLDISSRHKPTFYTVSDQNQILLHSIWPKKDHKTRWWGLNFMVLGHLCADWYFTAN